MVIFGWKLVGLGLTSFSEVHHGVRLGVDWDSVDDDVWRVVSVGPVSRASHGEVNQEGEDRGSCNKLYKKSIKSQKSKN